MLALTRNADSSWILGLVDLKLITNKVFFAALLLASVAVFVPFAPILPADGLDPSWVYGLNEAVAKGLSFGKDIVFTFGPYASIYTKNYHPATDQLMIWGALYLAISFAAVAYLNFRSAGWPLKIALFAILSSVMHSRDALFFFYPLLAGVQIYHWTISSDPKRDSGPTEIALAFLLFAPFGLFPLIKGSAIIACAGMSFLSVALLAKLGQWKLCLFIGMTPLVSLVTFWKLSGQSINGLADYVFGLVPIFSGFSEAMATSGDPNEYIFYTAVTAFLVGLLLRETQGSAFDKLIVALMFLFILFLAFKAGFVRHDAHAIIPGTMILLAAVLGATLLNVRSSLVVLCASLLMWGYIDAAHIKTSTFSVKQNIKNTYSSAWAGLKQRLRDPEALAHAFKTRVNEINERGGVPKLDGSVDIYSYDQSNLIAAGNNWNPRPVFQSYSVYTSELAELNRMHLVAENKPDNVIFKVQPIDGRLPSLEDGASWPVLLSSYVPISFSNDFLYLKSRNASQQSYDQPRKIGGGVHSLGQPVSLPDSDAPLFAKVNIRKSFAGEILSALFKPSQLTIRLIMHNAAVREYRLVAGMSASGFIVSPLVENTKDLGLLFSGVNYLNDKKVKSIEIAANSFSWFWKGSYAISFYELSFCSAPDFIEKLVSAKPSN